MKHLILSFAVLLMMGSCSKNEDSNSGTSRIVIKGTISDNVKSAGLKSDNPLLLSDAKKLLVFNSTGYQLFNIDGGSFTAKALSGTATALAFPDGENRYIGCFISMGRPIVAEIDLIT